MNELERIEFDGFMKAKRQITTSILGRIEILEEQRGDAAFTADREARIEELEALRKYIRNVVLYKVESVK
jgi:hypothetical protein